MIAKERNPRNSPMGTHSFVNTYLDLLIATSLQNYYRRQIVLSMKLAIQLYKLSGSNYFHRVHLITCVNSVLTGDFLGGLGSSHGATKCSSKCECFLIIVFCHNLSVLKCCFSHYLYRVWALG